RQQQVEIIKALWRGSQVLILDEPTSMLTPQAVTELQNVLQRLKKTGLAVVFITHKLHEAVALGDRISVLRQGKVTGTIDHERVRSSSPEELETEIVRLMFGDSGTGSELPELHVETDGHRPDAASRSAGSDEVALELSHASARGEGAQPGIEDVSLMLKLGEVL